MPGSLTVNHRLILLEAWKDMGSIVIPVASNIDLAKGHPQGEDIEH